MKKFPKYRNREGLFISVQFRLFLPRGKTGKRLSEFL